MPDTAEQENPEYRRPMTIYVGVDRNYLTGDGEFPSTERGWYYLERELKKHLPTGIPGSIDIECGSWNGPPEPV